MLIKLFLNVKNPPLFTRRSNLCSQDDIFVDDGENSPPQLSLEFRVYLVNAQTGTHTQESRTLQFWFCDQLRDTEQPTVAQEFFKELVAPQEFPRGNRNFLLSINKIILF